MSFGILGTVAAITVERIFGVFEDRCACLPCPLEVFIHVVHIDVKALGRLTEPFWIFIVQTGIAHHNDNPAWATDLIYGDHFIFGISGLAAGPGYPIVQVPAGMVSGVPLGISFFGTAFSEPTLIRLASGFEATTQARAHNLPTFAPTAPFDHIAGSTLLPPHRRGVPPRDKQKSSTTKPFHPGAVQGEKEHRRPHHL